MYTCNHTQQLLIDLSLFIFDNMGSFKKYQIIVLSLIVVLLSLTPFLSSSIRPAHLYIVINILILTVGVESGLLCRSPKPPNEEKKSVQSNAVVSREKPDSSTIVSTTNKIVTELVKQSSMEKISTVAVEGVDKVKSPSIFFISSGEVEGDQVLKDEDGGDLCTVGDAMAEQELSTKADDFINNFYKQLKMQREES